MLYLIVECSELGDQWECDANRTPLCLTNDANQYGAGYEVYQVNSDNTFTLIKTYDEAFESGMALYQWDDNDDDGEETPEILEKWKNKGRDDITKSQIKNIKKKIGFCATVNEIMNDICSCGSHGETIQNKWVVFGEYRDGNYSLGY